MNNKLRYFFDLHQILFSEDCYILLVLSWRQSTKRMTKQAKR